MNLSRPGNFVRRVGATGVDTLSGDVRPEQLPRRFSQLVLITKLELHLMLLYVTINSASGRKGSEVTTLRSEKLRLRVRG